MMSTTNDNINFQNYNWKLDNEFRKTKAHIQNGYNQDTVQCSASFGQDSVIMCVLLGLNWTNSKQESVQV